MTFSGENTASRRVSFAAHAKVNLFDKETKISAGSSTSDGKRRQSKSQETGEQRARFADGEGGYDENTDPQTGAPRRKSMRRRS